MVVQLGKKKETQLKEAYLKALETLKKNGQTESYYDLINILEEVAKTSSDFEKRRKDKLFQFLINL